MEIEIGITSLLLLLMAFLATIDMAFGQLSDVGLRRLMTEREERVGTPANAFLNVVLENRPRFRFTLTAVIQLLLVAVTVLVTSISLRLFPETRFVLIAFFIGVVLTTIFRQVIPRLLSLRDPERTLLLLLPFFRPFYRLVSFVAIPWYRSFDLMRRERQQKNETEAGDSEESDNDNIQALIDVGEEEGILEEEEGELIQSILEFGDTRVNEVMTPRIDIVALPVAATVREARDMMLESKYSRLPVYREQIDNVEGLIYVRDLLQCWAEGRDDESIAALLRPAYFVPETKSVADLLGEMQKAHAQLAMVID
ncbi:MAG: CNNM domain-containing protein, partial [Acidobacteriota bacterium]|nr:CNNM domain-containing protein [Acidobacteriota bacterium]